MKITLSRSKVRLNPAQHVAMVEIRHEDGDRMIRLIHMTGSDADSDSEFKLLGQSPSWAVNEIALDSGTSQAQAFDTFETLGIPAIYHPVFPLLGEIDFLKPPADYRTELGGFDNDIAFVSGQRYRVFVLGDTLIETIVVAE